MVSKILYFLVKVKEKKYERTDMYIFVSSEFLNNSYVLMLWRLEPIANWKMIKA